MPAAISRFKNSPVLARIEAIIGKNVEPIITTEKKRKTSYIVNVPGRH